ncbi:17252_t:CDS:2, partial [Racocetra persica]
RKENNMSSKIFPKEGEIQSIPIVSNDFQNEFDDKIVVVPTTTDDIEGIQPFEVFINNALETGLDCPKPKQTLSIAIPTSLYQKLMKEVGKGKIGKFIKETVEEKLEQEKENLVISNDTQNLFSPLITVMPITSLKAGDKIFPFQIFIQLKKESVILVDQIQTIDREKFLDRIAKVSEEIMEKIVEKYEKYLNQSIIIKRGDEEIPVPFIQILDALTGSGKTVILAKTAGEISKLSPLKPIILWLSKASVVVEQSFNNLTSGGKYHHLLGKSEVIMLSEYQERLLEENETLVLFATVGTFNQKDKEA